MNYGTIPRITLQGDAHQRGVQHGRAAAGLIGRAVSIYRDWFGWFGGVTWEQARAGAGTSWAMITRHCPGIAAEIEGIAEGSGRDLMDIVALNARTEIAYGLGIAHRLAAGGDDGGCTSFAVLPQHTGGTGLIAGQNWDWLEACMPIRVALDVELENGLRLLTFCEAGQVGKIGFNSAGLVVCLNLLGTTADTADGLPVHVICRLALEQSTLSDTLRVVASYPRAASGNLLVARGTPGGDGEALDVEYSPRRWAAIEPEGGILVHANHFLTDPGATDQAEVRAAGKSTFVRQMRARHLLEAACGIGGRPQDLTSATACGPAEITGVLADHYDHPYSVCNHVSGRPEEKGQTNLAFMALPSLEEFWLSDGPPCGEGRPQGPAFGKYPMPWREG